MGSCGWRQNFSSRSSIALALKSYWVSGFRIGCSFKCFLKKWNFSFVNSGSNDHLGIAAMCNKARALLFRWGKLCRQRNLLDPRYMEGNLFWPISVPRLKPDRINPIAELQKLEPWTRSELWQSSPTFLLVDEIKWELELKHDSQFIAKKLSRLIDTDLSASELLVIIPTPYFCKKV